MLGVSQIALETEFFMVDLPRFISAKQRTEKERHLMTLNTLVAANNRILDQVDYKKFVAQLTPETTRVEPSKFDRDKFEELRAMTLSGGNKAKI